MIFKGVRVEAIRVVKDNGLPFPPILKIEFCAVFRGDGAHRIPLIVAGVRCSLNDPLSRCQDNIFTEQDNG